MNQFTIKKLEDCLDGTMIFSYTIKNEIDESLMKELAFKGKLQFYPEFPKPFFKVTTKEGIQIKGIIGEDNFEVIYPQNNKKEKKKNFDINLKNLLK